MKVKRALIRVYMPQIRVDILCERSHIEIDQSKNEGTLQEVRVAMREKDLRCLKRNWGLNGTLDLNSTLAFRHPPSHPLALILLTYLFEVCTATHIIIFERN
jgi:hypothetical protein